MTDEEDNSVETKDIRATLKAEGSWSKEVKEELLQNYDPIKRELKTLKGWQNRANASDSNHYSDDKGYRLDSNTPVYYEKKEEILETSITLINNSLRAAGVPDNKKLYVKIYIYK